MDEEYIVTLFRAFHDNDYSHKDLIQLGFNPIGVDVTRPSHKSWKDCQCRASEQIRERVSKMPLEEDSPSNMLTVEEHITLFNKVKLLSKDVVTEELIARRRLMNKAIAIQRTHVQGMTVEINERRERGTRKEKEAIIAADKKYQPHLRVEEKVTDAEAKNIRQANEDPEIAAMLKVLPTQMRQALLSLVKQVGVKAAKEIFAGQEPSDDPEPETGEQTEVIEDDGQN